MKILPHHKYLKICFTLASLLVNHFISHFNAYYHFLRGANYLLQLVNCFTLKNETNVNWKGFSRMLKVTDFHF